MLFLYRKDDVGHCLYPCALVLQILTVHQKIADRSDKGGNTNALEAAKIRRSLESEYAAGKAEFRSTLLLHQRSVFSGGEAGARALRKSKVELACIGLQAIRRPKKAKIAQWRRARRLNKPVAYGGTACYLSVGASCNVAGDGPSDNRPSRKGRAPTQNDAQRKKAPDAFIAKMETMNRAEMLHWMFQGKTPSQTVTKFLNAKQPEPVAMVTEITLLTLKRMYGGKFDLGNASNSNFYCVVANYHRMYCQYPDADTRQENECILDFVQTG